MLVLISVSKYVVWVVSVMMEVDVNESVVGAFYEIVNLVIVARGLTYYRSNGRCSDDCHCRQYSSSDCRQSTRKCRSGFDVYIFVGIDLEYLSACSN